MAAPLPAFRVKIFNDPLALQQYVVAATSDVHSIVAIVCDSSGKYILYYMNA
jgi:hypothetical protein